MEVFHIIWSSYNQKHQYIIGNLIYDDRWYFKYNLMNIDEAIQYGFRPFPGMDDTTKAYDDTQLLTTFFSRYKSDDSSSMITLMQNDQGELMTDKILIKRLQWQGVKKSE